MDRWSTLRLLVNLGRGGVYTRMGSAVPARDVLNRTVDQRHRSTFVGDVFAPTTGTTTEDPAVRWGTRRDRAIARHAAVVQREPPRVVDSSPMPADVVARIPGGVPRDRAVVQRQRAAGGNGTAISPRDVPTCDRHAAERGRDCTVAQPEDAMNAVAIDR